MKESQTPNIDAGELSAIGKQASLGAMTRLNYELLKASREPTQFGSRTTFAYV